MREDLANLEFRHGFTAPCHPVLHSKLDRSQRKLCAGRRHPLEAMARAGRQLAGASGRVVDDNGSPLDDRALVAIGAQLEAVRATLAGRGIEPGSPLALRLFS